MHRQSCGYARTDIDDHPRLVPSLFSGRYIQPASQEDEHAELHRYVQCGDHRMHEVKAVSLRRQSDPPDFHLHADLRLFASTRGGPHPGSPAPTRRALRVTI